MKLFYFIIAAIIFCHYLVDFSTSLRANKKNTAEAHKKKQVKLKRKGFLESSKNSASKYEKFLNKLGAVATVRNETLAAELEPEKNNEEVPEEEESRSSNTLDPNACGRSIGKTVQKQVFIPNPALDFLSPDQLQEITKRKKCKVKSGLIYMLEKSNNYDSELKVVLVYLNADLKKIRLYQSTDPASKFHVIKQSDFIKIGQKYKTTTCFEIVSRSDPDPENFEDDKMKRGELTLCTLNVKAEHDWVRDLVRMKECSEKADNLLADFVSVNQAYSKLAKKKSKGSKKSPILTAPLFYSTNNGVYEEFEPLHDTIGDKLKAEVKFSPVGNVLQHIHETVKNATLQEEGIKKELVEKLVEAKDTANQIEKKKEIMQNLIESRWSVEKEKQEELLKNEHEERQVEILKKVEDDIKSLKVT